MIKRNETYYENRISLLSERAGRENGKIIAKLKRQLRKLKEEEAQSKEV